MLSAPATTKTDSEIQATLRHQFSVLVRIFPPGMAVKTHFRGYICYSTKNIGNAEAECKKM